MSKIRVCFLGTPEFAVKCLAAVIQDEHYEVVGVVTQPDRPAGRKLQLTPCPVKLLAQQHSLRVISPESVNKQAIRDEIVSWKAEVAIVVAFGQILGQKFLDLFPFGAVNVHASLLPRWRGAAPIQRAIEAGDAETGVALQKVVKELDAGDVLGIRKIKITDDMDALGLHDELAKLGAETLNIELMDYIRGNLVPHPQGTQGITYARKIDKSEGEINWQQSAQEIFNKMRAFTLGPGVSTSYIGKRLKIHKAEVLSGKSKHSAGHIENVSDAGLDVATGSGIFRILELQPESRNRMIVKDFVKGYPLKAGDRFGS